MNNEYHTFTNTRYEALDSKNESVLTGSRAWAAIVHVSLVIPSKNTSVVNYKEKKRYHD